MANILLSQDSTKPGLKFAKGPTLTAAFEIPINGLDSTAGSNGDVVTKVAGVWTATATPPSSDTASNVGAGTGTIFKQKTGADFEFKTLIAGSNITIANGASDITIASTTTSAFTASFTSSNQTITANGSLTLAHGLGSIPKLVQLRLKCLAAQFNYSIGDEVIIYANVEDSASAYGVAVVPDATNIFLRYGGGGGSVFQLLDKTTGSTGNSITNASWALIVKAWA